MREWTLLLLNCVAALQCLDGTNGRGDHTCHGQACVSEAVHYTHTLTGVVSSLTYRTCARHVQCVVRGIPNDTCVGAAQLTPITAQHFLQSQQRRLHKYIHDTRPNDNLKLYQVLNETAQVCCCTSGALCNRQQSNVTDSTDGRQQHGSKANRTSLPVYSWLSLLLCCCTHLRTSLLGWAHTIISSHV